MSNRFDEEPDDIFDDEAFDIDDELFDDDRLMADIIEFHGNPDYNKAA